MAKKLSVQVIGAPLKRDVEASTVQELMTTLGQSGDVSAIVNQAPQSKDHVLSDGDFIVFTQNIKGAMSWDDLNESDDSGVEYVFESPVLVIARLDKDSYRVNGLAMRKDNLAELFHAVGAELLMDTTEELL